MVSSFSDCSWQPNSREEIMVQEILSVTEFAKLIGSSREIVLAMIKTGKIIAFRLSDSPKSRFRIKASEVDRLISLELHKRTFDENIQKTHSK